MEKGEDLMIKLDKELPGGLMDAKKVIICGKCITQCEDVPGIIVRLNQKKVGWFIEEECTVTKIGIGHFRNIFSEVGYNAHYFQILFKDGKEQIIEYNGANKNELVVIQKEKIVQSVINRFNRMQKFPVRLRPIYESVARNLYYTIGIYFRNLF